jgi:hypothetical protein
MNLRRTRGMTLLELLIVITLIMLMVGFASFNYTKIVAEQKEGKAKNECREYVKALKTWENKRGVPVREYVAEDGRTSVNCAMCNRVVETAKECRRCGQRLPTRLFELADLSREYIIKSVGDDPWSNEYTMDTARGVVKSFGPDRLPNTFDDIEVPFRPVFRILRCKQDTQHNLLLVEFSRAVDRSSVTTLTVKSGAPVPITTLSMDMHNPYRVQAHFSTKLAKASFEVTVPDTIRSRDGTKIATDELTVSTEQSSTSTS